jgi:hypothetical protein
MFFAQSKRPRFKIYNVYFNNICNNAGVNQLFQAMAILPPRFMVMWHVYNRYVHTYTHSCISTEQRTDLTACERSWAYVVLEAYTVQFTIYTNFKKIN